MSKDIPFSEIRKGQVCLFEVGQKITSAWEQINDHHPHVIAEDHVVMPDHFHGIIHIQQYPIKDSNVLNTGTLRSGSLGVVINQFKGAVTRWCRLNDLQEFKWQSGFYDRIIRRDRELELVRKYIELNPARWERRHR